MKFIEESLLSFIHHRNQLKHYRSVIHMLRNQFDSLQIDIDLSENVQVSVKEEPQSLHWISHEATKVWILIMESDNAV